VNSSIRRRSINANQSINAKSSIRQKCDQPEPFSIICLEVTAVKEIGYWLLYNGTLQTFALLTIRKNMMLEKILKRHKKSAKSKPPILNRLEMSGS
jgi:hypothetical protein